MNPDILVSKLIQEHYPVKNLKSLEELYPIMNEYVKSIPSPQYPHRPCTHCHSCLAAVQHDHVTCLSNLITNGHPCKDSLIADAARYGSVDCLTYLHQHGFPLTAQVFECAILSRNGKCILYLHQNKCPTV
jgi:hypothetical protein